MGRAEGLDASKGESGMSGRPTGKDSAFYTSAYAIRVNDQWFAGFGGKPGHDLLTKLRPGLCDAKLLWDGQKAAAYIKRLHERGFDGSIVKVTA